MSRRAKHPGPVYQGFDAHLHVTVSISQLIKVKKLAKREGVNVSELMRGVINELK